MQHLQKTGGGSPRSPVNTITSLAGACEPAWSSLPTLPFPFQLSSVNFLCPALPRVTEHGSRVTSHFLSSLPRYLLTSLPLAALPAPPATLFPHGTPTPRSTFPRRYPLARRDRARHPRFTALHRPAPARRSACLGRTSPARPPADPTP